MMPAFTLCESFHFTLEKFIFYVRNLNTRFSESSVFSNELIGDPVNRFSVNGITRLVSGEGPSWLPEATHKVTAVRVTKSDDKNELKFQKGTDFFILSNPVGEYEATQGE